MAIEQIDATTLKRWIEEGNATVVDVREPAEFAAEHIEGSVLLPLSSVCCSALPEQAGKKLVVHCQRGARGNSACDKLQAENPVQQLYHLQGGIAAWKEAGFPVESSGTWILPLDRQVQLTIGLCLLISSLLGYFGAHGFFLVTGFFGAGLTFAGITGFCGLARLMAKMPWNQRS